LSRFYLDCFFFLGRFRGISSSGLLSLTFSDIERYAERIGIRTTEGVLFFADIMAGLDAVYLKFMREKAKRKQAAERAKAARKRPITRR